MVKPIIPAVIAAAIALSSPSVGIAGMSRSDYYEAQGRYAAAYKGERAACETRVANAKDICLAEARGRDMAARTELQAAYRPTARNRYDALLARAEGDYLTAIEKCDEHTDIVKEACVKEARAARIASKGDARTKMLAADAAGGPEPGR